MGGESVYISTSNMFGHVKMVFALKCTFLQASFFQDNFPQATKQEWRWGR